MTGGHVGVGKAHHFAVGRGAEFQADASVSEAVHQLAVLRQCQAVADAVGVQVVAGLPDVFGAFAFARVDGHGQAGFKHGQKTGSQFSRVVCAFVARQVQAQQKARLIGHRRHRLPHHSGQGFALATIQNPNEADAGRLRQSVPILPVRRSTRLCQGRPKLGQPCRRIGRAVFVWAAAQLDIGQAFVSRLLHHGPRIRPQRSRVRQQRRPAQLARTLVSRKAVGVLLQRHSRLGHVPQLALQVRGAGVQQQRGAQFGTIWPFQTRRPVPRPL